MDPAYHVAQMTTREIDLAFPLASVARISTDLAQWRCYCEKIITNQSSPDAREHLMICANARGYLKALCLARLSDTAEGTVLDVPVQVIATVVDEDGVREALENSVRELASRTGSAVRFSAAQ